MQPLRKLLALGGLLVLGCLIAHAKENKADPSSKTPPPGFTALFNGKDLTGWQGLIPINRRAKMNADEREKEQKKADARILPHWRVEEGVLVYDGKADSLQTVK